MISLPARSPSITSPSDLARDRYGQADLTDAGPNLIDGLAVLTRIAFGLQPFDRPVFDADPGGEY
jgi:hypothetical protein